MNFTVYRSSAGSGKTFTLVKEYLKIALADENESPLKFRKILAITFTNKAAQEMKDRVIKALRELSAPTQKQDELARLLTEELKLDTLTLQQRSENLLRAILHNYSDFSIGTIDSFTHRIIRSFAYDLGLPMNFEVELEEEEMLQKAVDTLLNQIGINTEITNTLLRFSEEKTEDEKPWQIEKELKDTGKQLLKEQGSINAARLKELSLKDFSEIRTKVYQFNTEFEDRITFHSQQAIDLISSKDLSSEDFFQGNKGIYAWFHNVNKQDYRALATPNSFVVKTLEENKWTSGSAKKNGTEQDVNALADSLRDIYYKIEEYVKSNYPQYVTRKAISRHFYSLAVLNELEKILKTLRDEESVLHISEFNHIISKVVIDQPVPYIFEKLGARYSHFLIDEFQDTSVLQWENILPLLENGLSENHFSMVVGDAKQAIYRWRSGDVEQFVVLPQLMNKERNEFMEDRERSLIRHFREAELDKNYRSRKVIVDFNNQLFLSLANRLSSGYKQIYERVGQKIKDGNDGGYVELRFPLRQGLAEEIDAQYADESILLVKQLLAEGWKKRDIALLVRQNKEGSQLANLLIAEGIPVLSSDSLLIRNSPLICCLVSLLKCLEHPEDRIALTDVADYMNKTGRGLFPLHSVQQNKASVADVLKSFGINEDLQHLSVLPIYQQCESLIRIVFPNEQKNAWVVFFLDELLRFGATRNPDRESFFIWWEDRASKASVVIPEGTDAVNILTIHKAKGLEYPVVIMPFVDWKQSNKFNTLWVDLHDEEINKLKVALVSETKSLSESTVADQYDREVDKKILDQLNVLYVGCTRAVDQLYILSQRKTPVKNPEKSKPSEDKTNVIQWFDDIFKAELAQGDVITYGKKSGPSKHETDNTAQNFISISAGEGQWTGKIRVRKYSEESWSNEPTKREAGIVMHNLLQKLSHTTSVEDVVNSAINTGQISAEHRTEMTALLKSVTEHPELRSFFGKGSKEFSENDILIPGEKSSRPDRVVIANDTATVLEYKTGAESEDHVHQVKHYKSLLERMGYKSVTGKLIYLDPLKVVEI
jgi:ATP-dependent exoDNAse (exonuclease V) beta subunit